MSKSKRSKKKIGLFNIPPEIKKDILVIFILLVAFLSLLSIFNLTGEFGRNIDNFWKMVFGWGWWLWPFLLILSAFLILNKDKYEIRASRWTGLILFILSFYGLLELALKNRSFDMVQQGVGGGLIGYLVTMPLCQIINFWGALIVLIALFVISLLIFFETTINNVLETLHLPSFKIFTNLKHKFSKSDEDKEIGFESKEIEELEEFSEEENMEQNLDKKSKDKFKKKKHKIFAKIDLPLDLLNGKSAQPTAGDIKENQKIIKKTLKHFGIEVEMDEVSIGPTVTQYCFKPASGVKVSQITTLHNDLALALAAHPIRIEAPIPGKSSIGIEVPNKKAALVSIKEILSSTRFKQRQSNLSLALGKNVAGQGVLADLDKMPHILVAGATNSGKTVCLNSFIVSLLYQNQPDELKLILVDPKQVEMVQYNNIPHLLCPVITDIKKTVNALHWAVKEMEERFNTLSQAGHRNIHSYNNAGPQEKMPYLVIVIDELADLMSVAAADIEQAVIRLAQKARAVGIHLIIATQKPSVDVITGLIKSNITARIAFSVASSSDSRTILDFSGAEKLLGNGDMLYINSQLSKPLRIQGCFLSDDEINKVVAYLKKQGEPEYNEEITQPQTSMGSKTFGALDDQDDELLPEAKQIVIKAGKASSSYLQRRLRIGYARAARLLDLLEEQGVVGPQEGSKPREVYGSPEELEADEILEKDKNKDEEDGEDEELNQLEESHEELKNLENDYKEKYEEEEE